MSKKAMAKIAEISKEHNKENLATHKVELSLFDDLDDVLKEGFKIADDVDKNLTVALKALDKAIAERLKINSVLKDADSYISDIDKALNELGMPSPELDKLQDRYDELEKLNNEFLKKINNL